MNKQNVIPEGAEMFCVIVWHQKNHLLMLLFFGELYAAPHVDQSGLNSSKNDRNKSD